jgi:hypothetical protein
MLGAQTAAALFDINDKTSLRVARDGSGGVPVEGDPVGVMMDVSGTGGLTMEAYLSGATELVTNGGFDDASDWTLGAGWSISGGELVATSAGGQATQDNVFSVTVGAGTYETTVVVSSYTSGNLTINTGSGSSDLLSISAPGTYSIISQNAGATAHRLYLSATSLTASISSVSSRELPGYTAVAASDAARPTLRTYDSPISSREILTTTYSWTITDGGRA